VNRFFLVLTLALSTVAAHAESPLALTTPREARQQASFDRMHAESSREIYSGQALGRMVRVSSFGATVNGTGPLGGLNLWYSGNAITGSSGGRPVNLTSWGGSISGYGPHGYVQLSATQTGVWGRVGNLAVNVNVYGNVASGNFGGWPFQLSGFDRINPVALAGLIGAL
jgi:hypothetical protein